jgi:putative tryptophan/tyrosine transport system substrate-binding protein
MKRRDFITLLGGVVAAWPVTARAQQAGNLPTIGFLGADPAVWAPWRDAFVQRLRDLGWIENRTVAIEYRWSQGRPERNAEIGTEFVRLKVDVIVTYAAAASDLKQVTVLVPIVFVLGADPVGSGLVASLARPGGNVTGLSAQTADIASKKLEFLREVSPHFGRLAIMSDAGFPEGRLEVNEAQAAAHAVGLEVALLEIQRSEDVAPAFTTLKPQSDALYVVGSGLIAANRTRIITLALGARVPTMLNTRVFAEAGALMSYGPDFSDQLRQAADYVDKILRGAKPGELPVEQPTKFELVINLTTAKALGLTIPSSLLAIADEVIE